MRRLGTLVVLAGLLAGGDVLVRQYAERQLEDRIRQHDPAVHDSSVAIDSFPFLVRLFLSGEVPTIRARVADVQAGPLAVAAVTVELRGVRLNRNLLVTRRQVELESIDSGTVEAEVTAAALSAALGVPVELGLDQATVQVAGRTITADLSVEDGELVVRAAGRSFRLKVPEAPLLPCVSSAQVEADRAVLRCTIEHVPPELIRLANRGLQGG